MNKPDTSEKIKTAPLPDDVAGRVEWCEEMRVMFLDMAQSFVAAWPEAARDPNFAKVLSGINTGQGFTKTADLIERLARENDCYSNEATALDAQLFDQRQEMQACIDELEDRLTLSKNQTDRTIAKLTAAMAALEDVGMMCRRLLAAVLVLDKNFNKTKLREQGWALLKKHGLEGNVLRAQEANDET